VQPSGCEIYNKRSLKTEAKCNFMVLKQTLRDIDTIVN